MTIDTLDLQEAREAAGLFTNEGDFLLGRSAPRYPIDLAAGDTFEAPSSGDPEVRSLSRHAT